MQKHFENIEIPVITVPTPSDSAIFHSDISELYKQNLLGKKKYDSLKAIECQNEKLLQQ
ncbi:MAG: hypothetical protein MJ211_10720 [Bacteroidales bacterium]|nr:hypothetical protein [Bacteroidales bacterium]